MDESDREARPPAPDDDRTGNDLPARAPHVPTTLHAAESDELFGSPMPPRLTARRLVLRALGIGTTVVLALALALPVLSNASVDLRTLLHIPTPMPTPILSPANYEFYWVDGVPWGELQVDGRPGPDLHQPLAQTAEGRPVLPSFSLSRGRHTLRYVAEFFPPLTCTVSVPAAPADTCPLSREDGSPDLALAQVRHERVLDLLATLERLPAEQRTALEQTIQVLLTASEAFATVAPGARYLGVDGQVKVATHTMRARPQYTLNADPHYPQPSFSTPCVTLCLLPPLDLLGPDIWGLVGHVVVHWTYTRADGAIELDQAPAAPMVQDAHVGVWLAVQWTGHWQVQFAPEILTNQAGNASAAPMMCLVGGAMLGGLDADPKTSAGETSYQWPFAAATPQQGCLWVGATHVDAQGHPVGPSAFVLYQFGVLLAANQQAVHLFPQALVATPADQALARQLAPPGASG